MRQLTPPAIIVAVLVLVCSLLPATAQTEYELLADDGLATDLFGHAVAVEGDVAIVGAPGWGGAALELDSGAAYVFRHDGSAWVQEQRIRPTDTGPNQSFGTAVGISGDAIIIGSGRGFGQAYIYRYDGSAWVEEQIILSVSMASGGFGYEVSIDGDVALVTEGEAGAGALFVFRYDGAMWALEDELTASDGESGDWLGISGALVGDVVIGGAHLDDFDPSNTNRGAAYVYRRDGTSWIEEQKITAGADELNDARFGLGSDIDGNLALVGAVHDFEATVRTGAVYAFRNDGSGWNRIQRFVPSEAGVDEYFGFDISMSGTYAVIGAPPDFRAMRPDLEGSAYFYTYNGAAWIKEARVKASDGADNERFGWDVSTDGTWVIVGAENHVHGTVNTGAAYVYRAEQLVSVSERDAQPAKLVLHSPYPNPVSDQTAMSFSLTHGSRVQLDVFDVSGRRVERIADRQFAPGTHSVAWRAGRHPPGVYFFRLTTTAQVLTTTAVKLSRSR